MQRAISPFVVLLMMLVFPPLSNADSIKILAFGDSLTAGYGLKEHEAFPVRLEKALTANGHDVTVINSGQSGDTTGAGLARVDWALFDKPDAVILELGANDMLRGLPVSSTKENLSKIITLFQAQSLPILLTGMLASESYGSEYKTEFDAVFPELAAEKKLMLYPFFLEGVAGNISLNQEDGIHPTAEGVDVIVSAILPTLEKFIKSSAIKP
jgi:acyl-CoA thioesterase I